MKQYLDFNGVKILANKINELNESSYPTVSATGINTYIGITSKIKSLEKGTKMTLFVDTDATGNCTLNLNNYGDKAIKDSFDNIVNNLKKNTPYNICYNGTDFILQGGIDDSESVYIGHEEPENDGLWIDTTDIVSDENVTDENLIAKQIKKYINDNVITKYDEEIKDLKSMDEGLSNEISNISKPNLLANGDFQINQQGLTSLTTRGYLADRWYIDKNSQDTDGKIEHKNREIILSNAKEDLSTSYMYLSQRFDSKDLSTFTGKTITFSADCKCESLTKGNYFLQIIYDCEDEEQNQDVDSRRIIKLLNNSNMTTEYTRHYISLAIPYDIKAIAFQIGYYYDEIYGGIVNQSAKFYMTNLKAELGNTPTPFISKPYIQELQDCLMYNNEKLQIPYLNPNLLINSDFKVWQRGTNFSPSNKSLYIADRWQVANLAECKYDLNALCATTKSDSTYSSIRQHIPVTELGVRLGNSLTLSVKVSSPQENVRSKIAIIIFNRDNNVVDRVDRQYILEKSWESKVITVTISTTKIPTDGYISVYLLEDAPSESNIIYFQNAKLEVGAVATPFVSRPYAEELALCQRYYEEVPAGQQVLGVKDNVNAFIYWNFIVEKRINPTVSFTHPGYDNNHVNAYSNNIELTNTPVEIEWTNKRTARMKIPALSSVPIGSAISAFGAITIDAEIY